MQYLIYPNDMRDREAAWFASGAARSIDIMENAAGALAEAVREHIPAGSVLYFACGSGGNGGDGTACARLLNDDYRCAIVLVSDAKTPDAVTNLSRACELGIPVYTAEAAKALPAPDAWIDAIFGTGFYDQPRTAVAELIDRMNADSCPIISADIPSGLDGLTGIASGSCVRAAVTVTFGWYKPGLVLADGLDRCGRIIRADVGFPEDAFEPFAAIMMDETACRQVLPARPRNTFKNRCGHLLIVAGSRGMAGAAVMCASAALRSGAGLVTVACPESITDILQIRVPQAMCVPLPEKDGAISAEAVPALAHALEGKTAAVIGCGLSLNATPQAIETVLNARIPTVVDADALNLIGRTPALFDRLHKDCVLTPHLGEAKRLLGGLAPNMHMPKDPIRAARVLRVYGTTVLLKGASSIIAGRDETWIDPFGCAGMARGGSGDILAGLLGALIADPLQTSVTRAAAAASVLHGLAGEAAQRHYGERAMNAMDILEFLPEVLKKCTPT